jgi:nitroimidazol reductase NimA-like FMN-containing flavoprotein (pyridoxamine 5'-phosphate oxidase superfamily)
MPDQMAWETVARGFSGRLATVSEDGSPYCIPLLYVLIDDLLYVHTASASGHFRANIDHEPRVCFEIDEPGEVFDYGRFECDSGLAYRSVILFGKMQRVDDPSTKQRFCEALMAKYGKPDSGRPKSFFPRIGVITVYAMSVERMTAKVQTLPPVSQQWPAQDMTKTPHASPRGK